MANITAANISDANASTAVDTVSALEAQMGALRLGALMGMIHAVTGPDHMSALITIAVNQRWAAAWLGIRWGVGHSTGLLIVTGLVLVLKDAYQLDQDEMLDLFTGGMDWVVGCLMLLLGLWGYRTAWRLRRASLTLPTEVTTVAQLSTESTTHSTSATLADGDGLSSQAVQPAAVEIEDASFLSPARTAATNRQPAAGTP